MKDYNRIVCNESPGIGGDNSKCLWFETIMPCLLIWVNFCIVLCWINPYILCWINPCISCPDCIFRRKKCYTHLMPILHFIKQKCCDSPINTRFDIRKLKILFTRHPSWSTPLGIGYYCSWTKGIVIPRLIPALTYVNCQIYSRAIPADRVPWALALETRVCIHHCRHLIVIKQHFWIVDLLC